jgi:hypothetical protein
MVKFETLAALARLSRMTKSQWMIAADQTYPLSSTTTKDATGAKWRTLHNISEPHDSTVQCLHGLHGLQNGP